MPSADVLRSLLYVPGDQPALFAKAVRSGPHALILDLEDAVDPSRKAAAREHVGEWLRRDKAATDPLDFVRINSWPAEASIDIDAVVSDGLDGLVLPKITSVSDVQRIDHILSHEEHVRGLEQGAISLMLIVESAAAVWDCQAIAVAAARVRYIVGGAAQGGDLQRSVGYEWTIGGTERLLINSTVVLGVRAADSVEPLYCGWMNVRDLDGLAADAARARGLGYTGALVIHPSHVAVVNAVFTPSEAAIRELVALVEAFDRGAAQGIGVVEHNGQMVDVAMARTARQTLDRLGLGGDGR